MELSTTVRFAEKSDAENMAQLYGYYVRFTPVTFETKIPTKKSFIDKMAQAKERGLPFLVCEKEGQFAGYTYASPFRPHPAYRWDVETSIYVTRTRQGGGVGSRLYQALFALLRAQGYLHAYAYITTPNPQSEKFHAGHGFIPVGTYYATGYKEGMWRDVLSMQKQLGEIPGSPHEPVRLEQVPAREILKQK